MTEPLLQHAEHRHLGFAARPKGDVTAFRRHRNGTAAITREGGNAKASARAEHRQRRTYEARKLRSDGAKLISLEFRQHEGERAEIVDQQGMREAGLAQLV